MPELPPFEILSQHCSADPDRTRFIFLNDLGEEERLSGQCLLERSMAFAAGLEKISKPGDRILLPFPAGLDFIVGFLGVIRAGRIPVPANFPRPRRPSSRYQTIADNCQASVAITSSATLATMDHSRESGLQWYAAEQVESGHVGSSGIEGSISCKHTGGGYKAENLLFLQYTSGSTSHPKGVMITSANLFANLEMIRFGFGLEKLPPEQRVVCSWLPAYHDMGLVGVILSTLVHDGTAVLMSPATFLRRPMLWLESIQRYQARITVAPCFGYQWATKRIAQEDIQGLDLSSLKLAACGAEPISATVLRNFSEHFRPSGFSADSFYPCYGLAEATLMASGEHRGATNESPSALPLTQHFDRNALSRNLAIPQPPNAKSIELVHCGRPSLHNDIALLSTTTGQRTSDGEVGEIVISSPSVAAGYWDALDASQATFGFRFPGESKAYLKTGDLGFMLDGRLYVAGRRKELIIIAGQNFYPNDIEHTASSAHEAIASLPSAAFSVPGVATESLVIVHEIPRGFNKAQCEQIIRKIRTSVAATHEIAPFAIVLVRQASIPKTTSGKVQRVETAEQFAANELNVLAQWELKAIDDGALFPDLKPLLKAGNQDRIRGRIENTLLKWVAAHTGEATEFVRNDQSFAETGIDSLLSVQLAQEFEQWLGCRISPVAAWSYPTPAQMAGFLMQQIASQMESQSPSEANHSIQLCDVLSGTPDDLISQLEGMDESDVCRLLEEGS